MTPYGRRTPSASAASSPNKPDMTLAASSAGPVARCGISSLRPDGGPHYQEPAFAETNSHSAKLWHVHCLTTTPEGTL
jgi:hypothetical protein